MRIRVIVLLQIVVVLAMLIFLSIATCGAIFLFNGRGTLAIALVSLFAGAGGFYGLLKLERALERAK